MRARAIVAVYAALVVATTALGAAGALTVDPLVFLVAGYVGGGALLVARQPGVAGSTLAVAALVRPVHASLWLRNGSRTPSA